METITDKDKALKAVKDNGVLLEYASARLRDNDQIVSEAVCLLYTSPSPRDRQKSRMPSSA